MCNQIQGRYIFIVAYSESPKLEIIQKSSHNKVDKLFVVYLDNGKLFSNEKSQTAIENNHVSKSPRRNIVDVHCYQRCNIVIKGARHKRIHIL